jgi:hypothetical protein
VTDCVNQHNLNLLLFYLKIEKMETPNKFLPSPLGNRIFLPTYHTEEQGKLAEMGILPHDLYRGQIKG